MRYLMLIHQNEAGVSSVPQQELYAEWGAFNAALAKAAGAAPGERMQPASAATTIRHRDGKTAVVDGPYADTKEQLAGYYFVEADNLDEAIKWAERCPASKYGAVEIRPIVPAGAGS